MNGNTNYSNTHQLKSELEEIGFLPEHIDIATKITTNKEEAINLIVRMIEEPSFYIQMKESITYNPQTYQGGLDNFKMVIVVREDLQMSKGKTAAQVGHAVLNAYKRGIKETPNLVQLWEDYSGTAKIVLSANSEQELLQLRDKAKEKNLNYAVIQDAGRTEVAPGTVTCLAIGPGKVQEIDEVTGKLSLLK